MPSTIFQGISSTELQTSVLGITPTQSASCFVVGYNPSWRVTNPVPPNTVVMCADESDFGAAFGPIDKKTTLGEHAYLAFRLFGTSPHFYLSVFDPAVHMVAGSPVTAAFVGTTMEIDQDFILSSVAVTNSGGTTPYVLGTDYLLSSIQNITTGAWGILITQLSGGAIGSGATIKVTGNVASPALITATTIIGGYNPTTDAYTGLAAVDLVFTEFQIVPTIIKAPHWDLQPAVAAAVKARTVLHGTFQAWSPVDLDTTIALKYSDAITLKGTNNIIDPHLDALWPKVGLGTDIFHLGNQASVLAGLVDAANNNLPFCSLANFQEFGLQMDRLCLQNGTTIKNPKDKADLLSLAGVQNVLRWTGPYTLWNDYTSAFPGNTDPKDCFRSCRRLIDFLANELKLQLFQFASKPLNARTVQTVRNTAQSYLDFLAKMGALVGTPLIAFRSQDNTPSNMVSGITNWYLDICPPPPLINLNLIISVDVTQLNTLFTDLTS
jgi:hypothetical protein